MTQEKQVLQVKLKRDGSLQAGGLELGDSDGRTHLGGKETLFSVCHQMNHLHGVFSVTVTFLKAGVTAHLTLCSS